MKINVGKYRSPSNSFFGGNVFTTGYDGLIIEFWTRNMSYFVSFKSKKKEFLQTLEHLRDIARSQVCDDGLNFGCEHMICAEHEELAEKIDKRIIKELYKE